MVEQYSPSPSPSQTSLSLDKVSISSTKQHYYSCLLFLLSIWVQSVVIEFSLGKNSQVNGGREGFEEGKYREVSRIGSSPPSCEHKCYGCMPCEAIQVPTTTSRVGVQYANYEPEGWKCKCGPTFYTPWLQNCRWRPLNLEECRGKHVLNIWKSSILQCSRMLLRRQAKMKLLHNVYQPMC